MDKPLEINDKVEILVGPYQGFTGTVTAVFEEGRVKVLLTIFGQPRGGQFTSEQVKRVGRE